MPYLISHLYVLTVSSSDFSYIRLAEVALAVVSGIALVCSPALRTWTGRAWAGALYILTLAAVWNVEGLNTLTFYPMSGFLFVILIAQCILPLVRHQQPSRGGLFCAAAAAVSACFCAYSNGPGVFLLYMAALPIVLASRDRGMLAHIGTWTFTGGAATLLVVVSWMAVFGDLKGFYIYHIYFNQHVYSKVIDFKPTDFVKNLDLSLQPALLVHSFSVLLMASWVSLRLLVRERHPSAKLRWLGAASLGAMMLGVLFTNPRGDLLYFDAGFFVTNAALFSLYGAVILESTFAARPIIAWSCSVLGPLAMTLVAYSVGAHAVSFYQVPQKDFPKFLTAAKPGSEPIYQFIRSITKRRNDLLVLNYGALIYIKADRLPASGNLFYLPWQAEYDRAPIDGYRIDICGDLRDRRPAVIWLLNRRIFGNASYPSRSLDEYEPCVLSFVTENYRPLGFGSPWHIRKDLLGTENGRTAPLAPPELDLDPNSPKILYLSRPLRPSTPIPLHMDSNHVQRQLPLRRIGILFATDSTYGSGSASAVLHLEGPKRNTLERRFKLENEATNTYTFFEVDLKEYFKGQIRSVEGGGLHTWESHFAQGPDSDPTTPYTCIIYEYENGTRRYTPMCPIM